MSSRTKRPPCVKGAGFLRSKKTNEYKKQYLLPFGPLEDLLEECRKHDLAIKSDGRWRLSPQGMLLSNSIISELLLIQERTMRK